MELFKDYPSLRSDRIVTYIVAGVKDDISGNRSCFHYLAVGLNKENRGTT